MHIDGTNRYTFKFPEHWRQQPNKSLTIGIRGIKLIYAPYDFAVCVRVVYYEKKSPSIYQGNSEVDRTMEVPLNIVGASLTSTRGVADMNPVCNAAVSTFMTDSSDNLGWFATNPFETGKEFNIGYNDTKRIMTIALKAPVTDARNLKYFKLSTEFLERKASPFSVDFQKLMNLPLDIPASGNNPARDGFITALAKICNTTDVFPADQKRMYEQFSRTFADTLKHVKIQFRYLTGYQIKVADVPPPPVDATPEESEGELEL
jgi:hypothetical protein